MEHLGRGWGCRDSLCQAEWWREPREGRQEGEGNSAATRNSYASLLRPPGPPDPRPTRWTPLVAAHPDRQQRVLQAQPLPGQSSLPTP